jgi:hypothetical protein
MKVLRETMLVIGIVSLAAVPAVSADEGDVPASAWDSTVAVVTNVVPITSAFVEGRCITGYVVCKLSFAGLSLVAAAEQVVLGGDTKGARATLGRGFGGDWYVRPSDIASGRTPEVYPAAEVDEDSNPYLPPI